MRKAMKSVFHLLPLVAALWLASCRTTSVSVPATVSAPTWTFTHGPPPALLLPTLSPTRREPPTWTPTLRPTVTPVPSASPTLGPLVTRTLAPPAECPPPGNPAPIEATYDPDDLLDEIELYLDTGGRILDLQEELTEVFPNLSYFEGVQDLMIAAIDVTGDGVGEAVIKLDLAEPEQGLVTFLFILGCDVGDYRVLLSKNVLGDGAGLSRMSLLATEDLNADGVPEVVYTLRRTGFSFDETDAVLIDEWDGEVFHPLVVPPSDDWLFEPHAAEMSNLFLIGDVRFNSYWRRGRTPEPVDIDTLLPDTDGNGTRELILRGGVSGGLWTGGGGPERADIDTWAWNGEAFTLFDSVPDPPKYRFQAVRDGDAAFQRGKLDQALEMYNGSLDDPDLLGWSEEHRRAHPFYWNGLPPVDPAERPRLAAYAEFRMLLVYAVERQEAEARSLVEAMTRQHLAGSPGYPYVQMATRFYEGLGEAGNVEAACSAAREFAMANAEVILAPLGSQYYGFFYDDYTPESICPVR